MYFDLMGLLTHIYITLLRRCWGSPGGGVLVGGGFSCASHRASSQRWLEAVRADSGERAAASKMDFDCVCLSTIHQVNYELYYTSYGLYYELYYGLY